MQAVFQYLSTFNTRFLVKGMRELARDFFLAHREQALSCL